MKFWDVTKKWAMRWGSRAASFIVVVGAGRPLNLQREKVVEQAVKNSSAVASVRWIQRNFSEAPICVGRIDDQDIVRTLRSPLLRLLQRPNNFYSGLTLWKATVADYIFTGNAYWIKDRSAERGGRNGQGRVTGLWWIPSNMMEPVGDPNNDKIFISHYVYTLEGVPNRIEVDDVVHFRDGFDPDNVRLGLSGFAALLKEVLSDNEAASFKLALLRNMGVAGVVISPEKDVEITPEDAEKIKVDFSAKFSGENRGMPLVTSAAVKVKNMTLDPKQMNLRELQKIDEERITAVIGIPAVVVGLGSGLERSTFANFTEAREAAYESCMIPMQQAFADEINIQLLPEFHNADNNIVYFDISKVRVLQPDINALHVRVRGDLLTGVITLNEARKELGREPIDGGDMFYVPNGVAVVQSPGVGIAPNNTDVSIAPGKAIDIQAEVAELLKDAA